MKIYEPKRILVPVDFSEFGGEVLEAGLEIGRLRHAEVLVLHVAREPEISSAGYGAGEFAVDAVQFVSREDILGESNAQLQSMLKEVSAGSDVKPNVVFGDPVVEILRAAESGDIDLIVMGTRGRRGVARLFIGSVTEEVIRRAPCPVLAIRMKGAQEEVSSAS